MKSNSSRCAYDVHPEAEAADRALLPPAGRSGGEHRGKDPQVPDSDKTTFTHHPGDAFRRSAAGAQVAPRALDVDQGSLGDCWLLGAAAAVAHRDPERIEGRIREGADGNFSVTLGSRTLTVRPTFPDAGYADPTPNRQSNTLWVALLEKAFAQLQGGYDDIEGGNPGEAMALITGRSSTETRIRTTSSAAALYRILKDAQDADHPATFETKDSGVQDPLHEDHTYAVLAVFERAGKKMVRLDNPWGANDGRRAASDLEIELEIDALRRSGSRICVNGS